jgi:hypothetical protein
MAIKINHKFIERLSNNESNIEINTIIIGTFNPGLPIPTLLDETEKLQFNEISNSKKFKSFYQIKNFYDRPKNRFWKVFDILNDPKFYNNNYDKVNPNGLKFYSSKATMDRDKTFQRQIKFCKEKKIQITDLVKTINPNSFCGIYDNFADTIIEQSNPEWNTESIKGMIRKYSPKRVLINFDFNGKSTPNLNTQINLIRSEFKSLEITRILSPSGAAGNSYNDLVQDWAYKFKF